MGSLTEQAPRLRYFARSLFCRRLKICAISSVVERLLHTQEVAGSNPASRTHLPIWSHADKTAYNAARNVKATKHIAVICAILFLGIRRLQRILFFACEGDLSRKSDSYANQQPRVE